jgi:hypothetical protein
MRLAAACSASIQNFSGWRPERDHLFLVQAQKQAHRIQSP